MQEAGTNLTCADSPCSSFHPPGYLATAKVTATTSSPMFTLPPSYPALYALPPDTLPATRQLFGSPGVQARKSTADPSDQRQLPSAALVPAAGRSVMPIQHPCASPTWPSRLATVAHTLTIDACSSTL